MMIVSDCVQLHPLFECFDERDEEEDYNDGEVEFDDEETDFSSTPGSSITVPSWRSLQMITMTTPSGDGKHTNCMKEQQLEP